jgi:hypothetical protein
LSKAALLAFDDQCALARQHEERLLTVLPPSTTRPFLVIRTGASATSRVSQSDCGHEARSVGVVFSRGPRRRIVEGIASLYDHVDGVVGRPDPDQVAVRVRDSTCRRSA